MTERIIRLLLVEDDEIDRMAMERYVSRKELRFDLQTAKSAEQALERLKSDTYDVVLLDYDLGTATAFDLMPQIGDTPVILVAGHGSEDIAVEAMRRGARDYLVKDEQRNYLALMPLTIRKVLEHWRSEAALAESEERLRSTIASMDDLVFILNGTGAFLDYYQSENKLESFVPHQELLGRRVADVFPPNIAQLIETAAAAVESTGDPQTVEYALEVSGKKRWFSAKLSMRKSSSGKFAGITIVVHDFSERKRAEELQKALFMVHAAAAEVDDVKSLLEITHQQIGLLMDAKNFYVALACEGRSDLYTFALYKDEKDEKAVAIDTPMTLNQGFTHWVAQSGKPLLANRETVERMLQKGRLSLMGTPSASWMGVPLKIRSGEVLGVVAVQSYTDENAYSDEDLKVLSFVSSGIAQALWRKRAETALRKAHEELEIRVERRTEELARVNEQLRLEAEERRKAENDQLNLQRQLHQAQKMEAIGRLAGGVAHDFNNLLTAIIGYSEMMFASLDFRDPMRNDVEEILKAANSASALTRQLLAFSRNQVISPEVLDLNQCISQIRKMLSRIIGEDINLEFDLEEDLAPVRIDLGQLEQVLVNLAVNARDAMDSGGTLRVQTRSVALDAERVQDEDIPPGEYVLLSVQDSGRGMDQETLGRIFEPFFTTKEVGKGTGLGLSTVYGIVKQSQGLIRVHSTPGGGTEFVLCFPRANGSTKGSPAQAAGKARTGTETILLVEDEEAVRSLTERLLKKLGYKVLSARHGGEALLICERTADPIDLVLTDVIMPQMNGKQLADRLRISQPRLRVLLMSGYTSDALGPQGVEEKDILLRKPFLMEELARKVREALDS